MPVSVCTTYFPVTLQHRARYNLTADMIKNNAHMNYVNNKWPLMTAIMLAITISSPAQPPRGPLVVSPVVLPDRKVTFRYLAPQAKQVSLNAQFDKGSLPMVRDSAGIWSVTTSPVKPDIYPYSFIVDGITVMDPANGEYFPNERFKASLVNIPGFTPLIHEMRNVPHGSVTYEYYPSAEGTIGSLLVYTPPGYRSSTAEKYPVFYLISGTTDTEETWFKVGKVNLILDNLIAEGRARPMIIVMPYGNVMARIAEQKQGMKPADPSGRETPDALARAAAFEKDLVNNILPYIEKNYSVYTDKANRAIGGFSRGGGQTLRTAFGNSDKFGSICCYSSYLTTTEMEKQYPDILANAAGTNGNFQLFWIGVGVDDFLYQPVAEFMNVLKSKDIKYKSLVSLGGHTWMNTKLYLAETVQLLFK
ncbi:MAG: alpha/beta hydrolase-fold protein [Chitinophagaceae bacterium]